MGAIEMNKIKDVADAVATFQATGKCSNKDLAKFLGDHPAGGAVAAKLSRANQVCANLANPGARARQSNSL